MNELIAVSGYIQAVPERESRVRTNLRPLLDANVGLFFDTEHQGPLFGMVETIKLALLRPETTHVLILEDDITICQDFLHGVRCAIDAQPSVPLHYCYLGKATTAMPDARFVQLAGWWGTQAYSLPVAVARELVQFCEAPKSGHIMAAIARAQPEYRPENALRWALASDVWLRFGLEVLGHPMWHTTPSLAGHGDPTATTTRFDLGDEEVAVRQSPWFIGEQSSARDIEWAVPACP